jgi:hypothetical protein
MTQRTMTAVKWTDTFVLNQSLFLRINICGKNYQLLIAAKCYYAPLAAPNFHHKSFPS